jgi:hypothetical protein
LSTIEGFRFTIGGGELKRHLVAKAEANRTRAAFLEDKAGEIRSRGPKQDPEAVLAELGADGFDLDLFPPRGIPGGSVAVLEQILSAVAKGIAHRRAAAQTFDFFASHVDEGAAFRLTFEDAERLELVEAWNVPDDLLYGPRRYRVGIR